MKKFSFGARPDGKSGMVPSGAGGQGRDKHLFQRFAENVLLCLFGNMQPFDPFNLCFYIIFAFIRKIQAENAAVFSCLKNDRFQLCVRKRPLRRALSVTDGGPACKNSGLQASARIVAHHRKRLIEKMIAPDML
ncbi:MAG: hypothetical protein IKD72_09610 [Clostridia bacterium]|nr:hypothetical protein [Clostridia bacterium]